MIKFEKLLGTPTLLVAVVAASIASSVGTAQAAPETSTPQNESQVIRQMGQDPLRGRASTTTAQVTSVSQLSDVKTTDWAFTALQSLVERYGCIAGYPDQTYRGQRAMTRFEFAAGLNACLDKANELITAGLADKVSREDLAALQRLQEEFAAELAALKGRVDGLDSKVARLEAQQFSTTTKLNADGIFALSGILNDQAGLKSNTTFSGRIRLNFDTSFFGTDRLRTRLQAGNVTRFDRAVSGALGGRQTRLSFDGSSPNTDNAFVLDKLFYRFPVGQSITAWVGTTGLDIDDVFNTFSPFFESAERGSISRFGRYNPLLLRGPQGAGGAVAFNLGPAFTIRGAYLTDASTAGNATGQGGITGGGYSAGAQLQFNPSRDIQIGAQYLRTFEPSSVLAFDSSTGSTRSQRPVGAADTSADRYGFLANWNIAPGFGLGGSVGFANARAESGVARANGATADVLTWDVKLAFPDLFGRGNLAGIIFGQQPRVTATSGQTGVNSGAERSTSYHLEALYRFQVSKNISITPGLFVVFNPNNDDRNNTIYVGTIRTTFSF